MIKKRTLVALLAIILAIAGFFALRPISDETRIRRLVAAAARGFNSSRTGAVLDVVDEEFRDRTSRADRTLLHQFLVAAFLKRQNQHEGELRYPVSVREGSLRIALTPEDPESATADLHAVFRDRTSEDETCWEIEVRAHLRKRDGEWRVRESEHKTLSGRPPF